MIYLEIQARGIVGLIQGGVKNHKCLPHPSFLFCLLIIPQSRTTPLSSAPTSPSRSPPNKKKRKQPILNIGHFRKHEV